MQSASADEGRNVVRRDHIENLSSEAPAATISALQDELNVQETVLRGFRQENVSLMESNRALREQHHREFAYGHAANLANGSSCLQPNITTSTFSVVSRAEPNRASGFTDEVLRFLNYIIIYFNFRQIIYKLLIYYLIYLINLNLLIII